MFEDFDPSAQELRDQLAGALQSGANFQNGGQTAVPEGYTPVSVRDYQGYSETVDALPPPAVQVLNASDPVLQPSGTGGGDPLVADQALEPGDFVVFVPTPLAPAILAGEPFNDDPITQQALQELEEDAEVPPTPASARFVFSAEHPGWQHSQRPGPSHR